MGDRAGRLALAVKLLDADPETEVVATSTAWLNKPIGVARGAFLNGAVTARTTHSPRGMLAL